MARHATLIETPQLQTMCEVSAADIVQIIVRGLPSTLTRASRRSDQEPLG